ncbi:MAG TPA: hypothetical protein ENL18_00890, partial [Thermoplasmatales archaeon]|nr:hypothetical protein [Thermoplasmatales archaeon]
MTITMKKKFLTILFVIVVVTGGFTIATSSTDSNTGELSSSDNTGKSAGNQNDYVVQWSKDYGTIDWWSARYEGAQPVGDADNDGKNELLIGGRDPFMRVMKWDESKQTYHEQAKIIDPVFG